MKIKDEVKVRKSWGVLNPATKRIESKKRYSRKEKFNRGWDQ